MLTDDEIRARVKGITLPILARRLGRVNRWGGAGTQCYSVLQHLLAMYDYCLRREGTLLALTAFILHDAGEPISGEVLRPFKRPEQVIEEGRVLPLLFEELRVPGQAATCGLIAGDIGALITADNDLAFAEHQYLNVNVPCIDPLPPSRLALDITERWAAVDSNADRDERPVAEHMWVLCVRDLFHRIDPLWNKEREPLSFEERHGPGQTTDLGPPHE